MNFPNFTWLEYINELLAGHERVEMSDEVIVRSPLYFKSFVDLVSQTPKRVLANYLMWKVAIESTDYLSERVLNITNNFFVRKRCFFLN